MLKHGSAPKTDSTRSSGSSGSRNAHSIAGSPGGEVLAHTHHRSSLHGADKADRKAERTRRSTQQTGPSQPRKGVGFQPGQRCTEGPIDTL